MTEEELIQRTRTLIQKWDNIRIVGAGWAGDTRRGFQFNPVQAAFSPAGTTPPPPTPSGACCPAEGDCFIATQSICESGGGTYQGDDTTCDPDPCPTTGACCVGTDCSIQTEADCLALGGTYQNDGTVCSSSCCQNCGFTFDGIHYYLHLEITAESPRCHTDIVGTWDVDPLTCVLPSPFDFQGHFTCDDGRSGNFPPIFACYPVTCTETVSTGDFDCFPDCGTITATLSVPTCST